MQTIIAAAHRPTTPEPNEHTYLFAGHKSHKRRPSNVRTQSAPATVERPDDKYTRFPVFRPRRAPLFGRITERAQAQAEELEIRAEASAFRLLMRAACCWLCCLRRR